ncbi:hypothetical protein V1509DRAFT_642081 [Lipomyces kononenkoae]
MSCHLSQPQVLAPSLHHHNGSSEDESHMPRSLHTLASAFNPIIPHDSPPLAYSLANQGNHHSQKAYYNPRSGYQQATTEHTVQTVHQAQQGGAHPNICLCPQVARVPRPRNAFILYRQHHHAAVVAEHPGKTNPEISKIIGEQWRQLSSEEKAVWQKLGDEEKKSHLERFPDYRYQPRRNSKRQGNDVHSNSNHVVSSGAAGLSPISICSRCHGQTPNSRGALFPKSPMMPEDSETHARFYRQPPSPPRGASLTTMLTSPSPSDRRGSYEHPTNPYLSGIKLPPASTAVAPASPPSLHRLPPIVTLPKDDVAFSSSMSSTTSSVSSTSPPGPPACIRTRSQDDARQGVEALLSLTQASSGTPSPKTSVAKLTTLPPYSSISSIVNSGLTADGDGLNHKRQCRSTSYEHDYARYSPPPSRRDSDSESQTLSQQARYHVAPSSSLDVLPNKEPTPLDDDGCRQTVRQGPSLQAPLIEKLREVAAIGVHLPRDKPRGAVIAVDGSPAVAKLVVAELVQRIDQLAVCETHRAFEEAGAEDGDHMPREAKILTKALAVHKELNGVFTFVNAHKSVVLDSYVFAFATDGCETLMSCGKSTGRTGDAMAVSSITNDCSCMPFPERLANKSAAEDWCWCANLYRGTILPDLIIYIDFDAQETRELSLEHGKTKVLLVGGTEHVGIIEQEVRTIMSEVGKN